MDEITERLVAQAIKFRPETSEWKWEVVVIDEPETLNAWAMAGGKMALYTGIINKLRLSDDEIAQIMGHEIGHALANRPSACRLQVPSRSGFVRHRSSAPAPSPTRWRCRQRPRHHGGRGTAQ